MTKVPDAKVALAGKSQTTSLAIIPREGISLADALPEEAMPADEA